MKSNPVRLTTLALALLATPFTASGQNYTASSNSSAGNITISSGNHTISVGSSGARTLNNAITLSGGTLQGGIMDNVATVSGLSGAGNSTTYVDVNGVTIILSGSGTTNTTANLTLASGVTITGANQLLVGGGGGGGGANNTTSGADGGGGGGGRVTLTTGNLSGTLALTAGGGGSGTGGFGTGGAGGTTSIDATQALGGGAGSVNGGTGSSGQTINGVTSNFTGGGNNRSGAGGGAGSSSNGNGASNHVGGAGGAGTQITTGVVGLSTYMGANTFGGGGGGGGNNGGGGGGGGGGGAGRTVSGDAGTNGLGGGGGGGGGSGNGGGAGGAGSVAIQYAYDSNVAAGNLTLSGGITLDSTSTLDAVRSGGLINVTGAITGAGGLNITSSASSGGVVQLSANNTYSGNTTIHGGTLKLTGAGNTGSGAVSLGTVGTLDVSEKTGGHTIGTLIGSGTVTGNLTVSTQLAIGNSPGTVTFNNGLILGNNATYTYELIGGASPGIGDADLANVSGALNITGAILDLVQLGTYTANNKFTLFAYSGGLTGTFKDAVGANLLDGASFTDAGGLWTIDYDDGTAGSNGGTGSQFVTITAIPEPSALTLFGGLGALVMLRRRR